MTELTIYLIYSAKEIRNVSEFERILLVARDEGHNEFHRTLLGLLVGEDP